MFSGHLFSVPSGALGLTVVGPPLWWDGNALPESDQPEFAARLRSMRGPRPSGRTHVRSPADRCALGVAHQLAEGRRTSPVREPCDGSVLCRIDLYQIKAPLRGAVRAAGAAGASSSPTASPKTGASTHPFNLRHPLGRKFRLATPSRRAFTCVRSVRPSLPIALELPQVPRGAWGEDNQRAGSVRSDGPCTATLGSMEPAVNADFQTGCK